MQWSYFFAMHRLDIGIALLIQYVAPILVALWARKSLAPVQLSGAVLTLMGIGLAQTAR